MAKITFLGAGSTIFAKNIIGDSLLTPSLSDSHIALYDIDGERLEESRLMIETLNKNMNGGKAKITAHLGVENRKAALKGSDFIVDAIQVGGYEPSTVIDFEIPKKYGLKQTIADTLGIGGIFRGVRTLQVLLDIAKDIEEVCPDAWMLNYTNPMSIVMGGILRGTGVKGVGLCHSVQGCASGLIKRVGMDVPENELNWKVAGINHMAWLLEVTQNGKDIYPQIKKLGADMNARALKGELPDHKDMVRFEIMRKFGYYITESSEHNAEYTPYWIKNNAPELIDLYRIPLDEYPRRCIKQIAQWNERKKDIVSNGALTHEKTHEYGSFIMDAIYTGSFHRIHGNIINNGLIPNLPANAVVEVPCLCDKNGIQGVYSGPLPTQCAALNMTNINVHLLAVEAALTGSKDTLYQAAFMDPHTAGELTLDQIVNLCDDLLDAHGDYMSIIKR
jgi:alpha-galactosidase